MTGIYECGHVKGPGYHNVMRCLLEQQIIKTKGNLHRLVRLAWACGLEPHEVKDMARQLGLLDKDGKAVA